MSTSPEAPAPGSDEAAETEVEPASIEPANGTGDDDVPAMTLYEHCSINVRGWDSDNEEEARTFAHGVLEMAREMSRYLDLSHLEAIVIGSDYREALASVDRSADASPAVPTSNEYGEGGAMAVSVVRNDEPWSVVVIWLPLVRQMIDTAHDHHKAGPARRA